MTSFDDAMEDLRQLGRCTAFAASDSAMAVKVHLPEQDGLKVSFTVTAPYFSEAAAEALSLARLIVGSKE